MKMRIARALLSALAVGIAFMASPSLAAEGPACRTPRLADIGWTDVTVTTAVAGRIFQGLGYTPKIQVLSLPVTYVSMKNKDIDIFLGNWMPTQDGDRKPFVDDHSIDVVRANLEGAKYVLGVPAYTYDAGLKNFADIPRFRDQLSGRIYGVEPGNDGNRAVLGMIKDNTYGVKDFDLVESSEQGMLAEVDRAIRRRQPIVFLAWEPHPMNTKYDIRYLEDPQAVFGPNQGAATIFTNVRAGYLTDCPNVGKFLQNLVFTLPTEDTIMGNILFDGAEPGKAAEDWLKANPAVWAKWLDGVTSFDGGSGVDAVTRSLGGGVSLVQRFGAVDNLITEHKLPLGAWLAKLVALATTHGQAFFDFVSVALGGLIGGLTTALLWLPPLLLVAVIAIGAYFLHRSIGLVAFIVLSLLLIINLGYWTATMETLSLVFSATIACVVVGVPVGIAAAHRPWLYTAIRPALDLMQTIPTFVYLIPTLVLFGLGAVPGLISTVIFSIPAPIRLTHLGISSVPVQLREAGEAFGATKRQLLFKVELPYALPTIMAGITQCIMLSLSMVVIAALVGADGLGKPVVRALNSVNVAMGFEAGLAIVVIAIILDRVCKRPEPRKRRGRGADR
jgi:glycine betaine/proline transport system substrate-binding protein